MKHIQNVIKVCSCQRPLAMSCVVIMSTACMSLPWTSYLVSAKTQARLFAVQTRFDASAWCGSRCSGSTFHHQKYAPHSWPDYGTHLPMRRLLAPVQFNSLSAYDAVCWLLLETVYLMQESRKGCQQSRCTML